MGFGQWAVECQSATVDRRDPPHFGRGTLGIPAVRATGPTTLRPGHDQLVTDPPPADRLAENQLAVAGPGVGPELDPGSTER